ncbi:hypothetical protein LK07_05515 [Streptomyces pluripotens]|uniref:Uncharacterized protein n=1 Tax=Streptomyces pluripotens TaxID=1355015 RepID=A0A221NUS7_9ACTN|nr:hypothetical protein [Streptomyces pluripotens]ARP69318.1 hypothetical protein LK06_004430 [Streptomyces pluripotens]ASN23576.1 hypothetical protein LK07_05515 [Streptomyces pluripotens]
MSTTTHTAVAIPLGLLESKTITVLVDSFQAAFVAAYGEEKQRKQIAKARLLATLRGLDEFRHSEHEREYRPA